MKGRIYTLTSIIIMLYLFLINNISFAQNITITDDDSYTADSSAMLDVKSTDKGMLVPRMDSLSREDISNPANGLLVYDTDANAFYYFNGTDWLNLTTNVTSPAEPDDDEALFSVVNAKGDTVFAVYQEGVVINVGDGNTKGNKGGFAVGGLSSGSKTPQYNENFLEVTPGEVTIRIDTIAEEKGNKGGFAVGGLSSGSKAPVYDFMEISPGNVQFYVDSADAAKGNKGGFAVGGLSSSGKVNVGNYLYVAHDTTSISNILEATTDILIGGEIFDADGGFYVQSDSVFDFDGNSYPVVAIGSQIWMAQNLRTTHYADGTPLVDGVVAGNISGDYDTKFYFWYQNEEILYGETYGALYTWAAAMNGSQSSDDIPSGVQGVCPDGWHLPSDNEWKDLEIFLGMNPLEAENTGYRGVNEGSKLAGNSEIWTDGSLDSDAEFGASGFMSVPSGRRLPAGTFSELSYESFHWSATEGDTDYSWRRNLTYGSATVLRNFDRNDYAYSVRCVKN